MKYETLWTKENQKKSNVFEYQKAYIEPMYKLMGIEFVIVKKSLYTNDDIYHRTRKGVDLILPGFFSTIHGQKGKQPSYCSSKWKTEVYRRYLNARFGTKFLTKKGVNSWIGFSSDEKHRAHDTKGKWKSYYPLIELGLSRQDCIKLVEDYGLPTPPRSNCWMCSNMTDDDWRSLSQTDFEKAVQFENELRKRHPHLYLHNSFKPLNEVDFANYKKYQLDFEFTGCSGACGF